MISDLEKVLIANLKREILGALRVATDAIDRARDVDLSETNLDYFHKQVLIAQAKLTFACSEALRLQSQLEKLSPNKKE